MLGFWLSWENSFEISMLEGSLNQRVPGSSPGAPTKAFKHLARCTVCERQTKTVFQTALFHRKSRCVALDNVTDVLVLRLGFSAHSNREDDRTAFRLLSHGRERISKCHRAVFSEPLFATRVARLP